MKRFKKVKWHSREELYVTNEKETLFTNVTNPMITLEAGEDDFTTEDIEDLSQKVYDYNGQKVRVQPEMYTNGYIALLLIPVDYPEEYEVITVNLEEMPAICMPAVTWADINNHPESADFMVRNGLAKRLPTTRRSGFVSYPVMYLDMVTIYAHNPKLFENCKFIQ